MEEEREVIFEDLGISEEDETTIGAPENPYEDCRSANALEKSLRGAEDVFWTREADEEDAEAVKKGILRRVEG